MRETQEDRFCDAPFFGIRAKDGIWTVSRGNCNRWHCSRCGLTVAKEHYWRIVKGAEEIAASGENDLYFLTVTCKGRELALDDAIEGYMAWTNRLFTALRANSRKRDLDWYYVQVTEKQKRGHPHSHVITTFYPCDKQKREGENKYDSAWLKKRIMSAGLGEQYDLSLVQDPSAASRYVAKYMFKSSMFDNIFPENWKRVRYSQNWPKNDMRTDAEVMLLRTKEDWRVLALNAVGVKLKDVTEVSYVASQLRGHDVIIIS